MKSKETQFRLDEHSGISLWAQIRRRIVYLIVTGHYQPGEQLPTVRELAVQLDVNYNTINKVYQQLERDGFIKTRRGKGTFVNNIDQKMMLVLDNTIDILADELVENGFELGMTPEEILGTVLKRITLHMQHNNEGIIDLHSAAVQMNESSDRENHAKAKAANK